METEAVPIQQAIAHKTRRYRVYPEVRTSNHRDRKMEGREEQTLLSTNSKAPIANTINNSSPVRNCSMNRNTSHRSRHRSTCLRNKYRSREQADSTGGSCVISSVAAGEVGDCRSFVAGRLAANTHCASPAPKGNILLTNTCRAGHLRSDGRDRRRVLDAAGT